MRLPWNKKPGKTSNNEKPSSDPCQGGHAMTYAWQMVKGRQVYGLKCCNTGCDHFEAY